MKKIIIILFITSLFITACSSNVEKVDNIEEITIENEDIISTPENDEVISTPEPTISNDNINNIPEQVTDLFESIKKIGEDNNYCYINANEPKEGILAYEFNLEYNENPSANGNALFEIKENSKSININFQESIYGNVAPPLITDALKAVIMYIDNTLTPNEAEDLIIKLHGNYDGATYSDIYELNDYYLLFTPTLFNKEFYAIYKEDIVTIDKSLYTQSNLENITSPLNVGKKYLISGTVEEIKERIIKGVASSQNYGSIIINSEDGNEYEIIVQYENTPITFTVGNDYNFYGYVGAYTEGEACLWAEFIESIN